LSNGYTKGKGKFNPADFKEMYRKYTPSKCFGQNQIDNNK